MRKASIVAGSIAVAAMGSVALGGAALAGGGHHHDDNDSYAGDGEGGTATNNCLNVGIPILSGIGLGGQGTADGASCSADANGTGGNAY
ncbi:MAG: hypothetical protein ACT4O0_06040 [Pseudonocardia sp.]